MASAAPTHSGGNYTCTGTAASPGTLAGNFANVTITGTCLVDAGNVNVAGNLIIAQNASLAADFGQNDKTDSGTSNITVRGNMMSRRVAARCSAAIRSRLPCGGPALPRPCSPTPDFPCDDEADPLNTPVLSATEYIGGNLIAYQPLGVVVHNTTVRGNVVQYGGGNGTAFDPVGIFAVYIPAVPRPPWPVRRTGPAARVHRLQQRQGRRQHGPGRDGHVLVRDHQEHRAGQPDRHQQHHRPDGNELSDNTVYGNLVCSGNNPAVEYGDSNGVPSKVGGHATGECGFNVLIPNPSPISVPGLPSYPLDHVSVHLHH